MSESWLVLKREEYQPSVFANECDTIHFIDQIRNSSRCCSSSFLTWKPLFDIHRIEQHLISSENTASAAILNQPVQPAMQTNTVLHRRTIIQHFSQTLQFSTKIQMEHRSYRAKAHDQCGRDTRGETKKLSEKQVLKMR